MSMETNKSGHGAPNNGGDNYEKTDVDVPAVAKSAPYIARPVTFGTPSGRIGRVPTNL